MATHTVLTLLVLIWHCYNNHDLHCLWINWSWMKIFLWKKIQQI